MARSNPNTDVIRTGWVPLLGGLLPHVLGVAATLAQHEGRQRQCQHHTGQDADLNDRAGEGGSLFEQGRRLHRQHDDLLDAGQNADDQERLRDDLTRPQAGPHGVEQFDENEDEQQPVENFEHGGIDGCVAQSQHGVELCDQQRDRSDDQHQRDPPIDRVFEHGENAVG